MAQLTQPIGTNCAKRWRCGVSGPAKLIRSARDTISHISRINGVSHAHLIHVVRERRNTPRLIKILEDHYRIPIKEIRAIWREHRERKEAGNPVTEAEAVDYQDQLRAKRMAAKNGTRWQTEYKQIREFRKEIPADAFAALAPKRRRK